MRHIPLCLVVPFVLACGQNVGPNVTIRVQGTVTAADDGSPVADAVVEVREIFDTPIFAREMTDASGDYSLSLVLEGCKHLLSMVVTSPGFLVEDIRLLTTPHITCTEELQTIDIQLERLPT